MEVTRVEVFLDGSETALAVIDAPPFTLRLDPQVLGEGQHVLSAVVYFEDGSSERHEYVFDVEQKGPVYVGHVARAAVKSPLEVELVDPVEKEALIRPSAFKHMVLPALLFLLVVGVAWWLSRAGDNGSSAGILAAGGVVSTLSPAAKSQPAQATGPADGQALYQQRCASCHQNDGQGIAGVFPALAQNPKLADETFVIKTILDGIPGTGMPAFGSQLDDPQVAAIASYIRTAWGNGFGSVDAGAVRALRGQ